MTGREYLELTIKISKDRTRIQVAKGMLRDGDYPETSADCIRVLRENVTYTKEQNANAK